MRGCHPIQPSASLLTAGENSRGPRPQGGGSRGWDVRAAGIRVGVVGVGYWGSRHVRVLRSTTGVAAVIAVDQQFAQIGSGRQGLEYGATAYPDLESALPHVDAVVIATPPGSHAPLALQAIAAGQHVLIEKPMATTTDAALAIMDAAAAAGVVLMPGHTFEHNAAPPSRGPPCPG